MPFSVTGWDTEHFQNTERFAKLVRNLYLAAIREATRLGLSVDHDPSKPFRFSDFPSLNKRVQQLFDDLAGNIQTVIHNGVDSEWDFANDKNDELLKSVFKTDKKLPERALARYTGRNQEALTAFKERKANGLDLSDRIWNPVKQFRSELEMALELGIADGKSADQISRDIRSYLENPDMLFRRIRKRKDGPLRLSQHAKAYNPGRGVSRSSYKNAQRLARTEINMAYREADFNRWQNFDFVVGIEVRRSNNPYGCDVCESLKGRYPKNFKFRSWHPNCRCHAISILATEEEINELELRMLNDEDLSDFRSVNEITEMPAGWDKWIKANEDRLLRAKSQPYFIRDNFKDGDPSKGLRFALAAPVTFKLNGDTRKQLVDAGFRFYFDDDSAYNNAMSGFNLLDFDKDMTAYESRGISWKKKILEHNDYTGSVMFTYAGVDKEGKEIILQRTFSNRNLKLVKHSYFEIPESMQGQGFSKEVFQSLYKQYQNAGIERIEVQANLDVGGYTWAKYGFAGKSKEKLKDVISRANFRLQGDDLKHFNNWMAKCEKTGVYAMWEIPDFPYGKRLLLGTDWSGYLDLKNSAQRQIFENYLAKSR